MDLFDRHSFIDLMHGLANKAEFHDRTVILDEACVRGATRSRKSRRDAGFGLHRPCNKIGKVAGRGQKALP